MSSAYNHPDRPMSASAFAKVNGRHGTLAPMSNAIAEIPERPSTSGSRRPRTPGLAGKRPMPQVSDFTKVLERTIDTLHGSTSYDHTVDEVRNILASIRKQYDDVHSEADKRETELAQIRGEIRLIEGLRDPKDVDLGYGAQNRHHVLSKLGQVTTEIEEAAETRIVYQHMVERLNRELRIVQQKISIMEKHLSRKVHEVQKQKVASRRINQEKIDGMLMLENMEADMDYENHNCVKALEDMKESVDRRRKEVQNREDFERWRYEIALESANEAFQATAGRYRKTYAVEKLTGNCLQKITYEQAEQSQKTEEGFQKIREVTGLTEVMDIVHKFLNRQAESDQLTAAVRETEMRLHNLREAEASRNVDVAAAFDPYLGNTDNQSSAPRGLNTLVVEHEQDLARVQRDFEELQHRQQKGTLLLDSVLRWTDSMAKSLATFDELETISRNEENNLSRFRRLPAFFENLGVTVDRFLQKCSEMPAGKLLKLTNEASNKANLEQQSLLGKKEFIKANCRVPATVDWRTEEVFGGRRGKAHTNTAAAEEDRQEQELAAERDALKLDSEKKIVEKEKRGLRPTGEDKRSRERDRSATKDNSTHNGGMAEETEVTNAVVPSDGLNGKPAVRPPSRPRSSPSPRRDDLAKKTESPSNRHGSWGMRNPADRGPRVPRGLVNGDERAHTPGKHAR